MDSKPKPVDSKMDDSLVSPSKSEPEESAEGEAKPKADGWIPGKVKVIDKKDLEKEQQRRKSVEAKRTRFASLHMIFSHLTSQNL